MADPASADAPPPPSAPKTPLLRSNVLWLSVVSFLNDAASEMIYPLLPLFLAGTLRAGPGTHRHRGGPSAPRPPVEIGG